MRKNITRSKFNLLNEINNYTFKIIGTPPKGPRVKYHVYTSNSVQTE